VLLPNFVNKTSSNDQLATDDITADGILFNQSSLSNATKGLEGR